MNTKTLRELCGEAKLDCEAYSFDERLPACFSIHTGDPVNTVFALIEVVLDNVDPDNVDCAESDALRVIQEVIDALRSPKLKEQGSDIIMFWPKWKWEE